jgi:hypothetical protein
MTTEKQIQNQTSTIHTLATQLGVIKEGESTLLNMGSKLNGRAFRLALLKIGSTAEHRHPLGDYLGRTKSEAGATLGHIMTTLDAVKNTQR